MLIVKEVLSERRFKTGYVVRRELWNTGFIEDGPRTTEMRAAYSQIDGGYIGNPKWAHRLVAKYGIKPEKSDPTHDVCSIGFSERDQKWYGWSHRAIFGFGIGSSVDSEDNLCAQSGQTEEYMAEYPADNKSLPVGFIARTLDDAKLMAIAFAEAVS